MEDNEFVVSIENNLKKSKLGAEIMEYCELNNINDVSKFTYDCLLSGFNIVRYGNSPIDNIKRQNGEINDAVNGNTINGESKIIKKKRKITIKNED